ncbi:MAG: hypothetical protein KDJ77_06265, partial [Rhodobiaceae bacterium]|nr:hypothetical protein [Rhodobiaceae bacterium]
CAVPGQNGHDWGASDTDWRTFKAMIDAVTTLNGGTLPFTHILNEHMVNRPGGVNNYAGAGNYQVQLSAWIAKLKSYYPGIPVWGVLNMPHANPNMDGFTTANNPPSDYGTWSATPSDLNCLANWIIDHLPGGTLESEYDFVVENYKSGIALDDDANRDLWKPRSNDTALSSAYSSGTDIVVAAERDPIDGETVTIDPQGNREEFTVASSTGSYPGPYTITLSGTPANTYLAGARVVLGYYGQLTADYTTGPTIYVDRNPGVGTRLVINPQELNGDSRGATVVRDVSGSGPYTLTNIGSANAANVTGADVLEGPADGYHVAGRVCVEIAENYWEPILKAQGIT